MRDGMETHQVMGPWEMSEVTDYDEDGTPTPGHEVRTVRSDRYGSPQIVVQFGLHATDAARRLVEVAPRLRYLLEMALRGAGEDPAQQEVLSPEEWAEVAAVLHYIETGEHPDRTQRQEHSLQSALELVTHRLREVNDGGDPGESVAVIFSKADVRLLRQIQEDTK